MSQDYTDLIRLPGFSFPIYMSPGVEQRTHEIAVRCERAHRFFSTTLDAKAQIQVLVLAPEHWLQYTDYPVYGMPHYIDPQTLLVAGENNGFWKNMAPPLEALPAPAARAARAAYGLPDGSVDYSSFFDLLAVHEMCHLFHLQASVEFPRLWLKEFFCNLGLHAYIAVETPDQLPILETLPNLVIGGGHQHLAHTTLADFERLYTSVDAQNYGWYQVQFYVAAKRAYDAGGIEVFRRLWGTFLQTKQVLSDEQLALCLRNQVHPEVELVQTAWSTQLAQQLTGISS